MLSCSILMSVGTGGGWRSARCLSCTPPPRTIRPYLADILDGASNGAIRKAATLQFNNFFAAIGEYGPYVGAVVVGLRMWWWGRAPLRFPPTLLFRSSRASAAVAELAVRRPAIDHRNPSWCSTKSCARSFTHCVATTLRRCCSRCLLFPVLDRHVGADPRRLSRQGWQRPRLVRRRPHQLREGWPSRPASAARSPASRPARSTTRYRFG